MKLGENPKLDNKTYITLRGIEDASIFVTGADKKLSSAASGSILLNSVVWIDYMQTIIYCLYSMYLSENSFHRKIIF